ncbi:MAG TPA: hydrolase [Thermoanaerobaculia bacterium]|nr:hydrolase [Thermoanaerobaculia bacterium]
MKPITEPALVWTGKVMLEGRLAVPREPSAIVIIASVPSLEADLRDAEIVEHMHRRNLAALFVPLLTEDEIQFDSRTGHFRHDADFLAQRFIDISQWIMRNRETNGLPVAYVGSSGAAAAAIVAASMRPELVSAIVSIDGRTDLAVDALRDLHTPILLVVRDMPVLRMNREVLTRIRGEKRLEIVHGEETEAVRHMIEKCASWLEERFALAVA